MADNEELLGTREDFSETLEAKIEAGEGMFEVEHPFLPAALRGLTERINEGGVVPLGMLMATQSYLYDINEGVSGFTGEPMPGEVVGMPQVMGSIVQMAVEDVARDAFGDEYADELLKIQREIRDSATS